MTWVRDLAALLVFPGGLFVLGLGLAYEWADRKILARLQNRLGPRWFQTGADLVGKRLRVDFTGDGDEANLCFVGMGGLAGAEEVEIGTVEEDDQALDHQTRPGTKSPTGEPLLARAGTYALIG